MLRTAGFVRENAQLEVLLRLKQSGNPQFSFLLPSDPLRPFFLWLVASPPAAMQSIDSARGTLRCPAPQQAAAEGAGGGGGDEREVMIPSEAAAGVAGGWADAQQQEVQAAGEGERAQEAGWRGEEEGKGEGSGPEGDEWRVGGSALISMMVGQYGEEDEEVQEGGQGSGGGPGEGVGAESGQAQKVAAVMLEAMKKLAAHVKVSRDKCVRVEGPPAHATPLVEELG
jgi:hypothetical protein